MGLLDSVLGSVLGGQQNGAQGGQGGLGELLGGLLGGQGQQGRGSLAALLPVVIGLLANSGQGGGGQGGLGGLMEKFNQAGMGDVLGSWIRTGPNPPISGEQLGQVLGGDKMSEIASQLGLSEGEAAGQLAQVLPGLIDKLTPQGAAPEGGFGSAGDLMGMLGGLLQQR
jgi:uncharacterized protein YidB (DUF937 family)